MDDFISAYSLLKSPISKEVIKNTIQSLLTKEEVDNLNLANISKNLNIIFEIFDSEETEVKDKRVKKNLKTDIDKRLYERTGKKGILSKILTKGTCDVNFTTVKMIAEELNSILSTKPLELKNGYIDNKRSEAEFKELLGDLNKDDLSSEGLNNLDLIYVHSDSNNVVSNDFDLSSKVSSKDYYRDFPITENDLYYGRFKKVDDTSSELDLLCLYYKKLKPLERKIVYNLIYELIYSHYHLILNSTRKQLNFYISYASELILKNIPKSE